MMEESKEGGADGWVLESDRRGPMVAKGRRHHGQERGIPLSLGQDFESSKYRARLFLRKWGWAVYPLVVIGLVVLAAGIMHLAFRAHRANMIAKHGIKRSASSSVGDRAASSRVGTREGKASSDSEPVTYGGKQDTHASRDSKGGSPLIDELGTVDPERHLGQPLVESDCDEMVLAAATIRLRDIDKITKGSHVGEGGHEDIMQEMVNSQQHLAIARKEHRHLTKLLAACEARKIRIAREKEFQMRVDEAQRKDRAEGRARSKGDWKFAGEEEGDPPRGVQSSKQQAPPPSDASEAPPPSDASKTFLGRGEEEKAESNQG